MFIFPAAIPACENRNCSKNKPNSKCYPLGNGDYKCGCDKAKGFIEQENKCIGMWYLFCIS